MWIVFHAWSLAMWDFFEGWQPLSTSDHSSSGDVPIWFSNWAFCGQTLPTDRKIWGEKNLRMLLCVVFSTSGTWSLLQLSGASWDTSIGRTLLLLRVHIHPIFMHTMTHASRVTPTSSGLVVTNNCKAKHLLVGRVTGAGRRYTVRYGTRVYQYNHVPGSACLHSPSLSQHSNFL